MLDEPTDEARGIMFEATSETRTPVEAAQEAVTDLREAAKAAGVTFPSLWLDPKPLGEDGALTHLIDTDRINIGTARKLTKILRAAR
ncbi:hypothetical protein [Streptomyces noursei]|uniref:hypothetical protein n=1 Tax=Streptomyces noursei TaxID=1971 RepID=UPI00045EF132|nr:hypothetical protein [Streptomyces noursei]AIA07003.1 hypothetical protein DC74_6569 [Streptomyces noursei]